MTDFHHAKVSSHGTKLGAHSGGYRSGVSPDFLVHLQGDATNLYLQDAREATKCLYKYHDGSDDSITQSEIFVMKEY